MHWAAQLVGLPYLEGAQGPHAFSCWGLVRHVFRGHFGIEFPDVVIAAELESPRDDGPNVRAIKAAARCSRMAPRAAGADPQHGDIVLLRSLTRLHCGVVLRLNGRLMVLHSHHSAGVVLDHWRDAIAGMSVELWGARES